MRILVAGSTGAIGHILVQKLIENGHVVTGIVRSSEQRDGLLNVGARAVITDVSQKNTLVDAVNDQDAVVFAAGSNA